MQLFFILKTTAQIALAVLLITFQNAPDDDDDDEATVAEAR